MFTRGNDLTGAYIRAFSWARIPLWKISDITPHFPRAGAQKLVFRLAQVANPIPAVLMALIFDVLQRSFAFKVTLKLPFRLVQGNTRLMNQYEIRFQPWDGSWCLSGPVGANGRLLFGSAKEAASHARWDAKTTGGVISVYDAAGNLFRAIEIKAEVSGGESYILPSV